jgi:hypothetical protein
MTTAEVDPFADIPTSDTGADPFADPERTTYPQTPGLVGRLVLMAPRSLKEIHFVEDGQAKSKWRMTTDVIVLDGDPVLSWVERNSGKERSVKLDSIPSPVIDGMWIESAGLISACKARLRTPNMPLALGRVARGEPSKPGQSAPYILQTPTDKDKALARPVADAYMKTRDAFAS